MYKPACIYEHQCWSRTQISLFHNHNISLAKHGRDAKPATHPLAPLHMVQRLYISFCLPQKRYKKAQINECNCAASTSHMPCTYPAHSHTHYQQTRVSVARKGHWMNQQQCRLPRRFYYLPTCCISTVDYPQDRPQLVNYIFNGPPINYLNSTEILLNVLVVSRRIFCLIQKICNSIFKPTIDQL